MWVRVIKVQYKIEKVCLVNNGVNYTLLFICKADFETTIKIFIAFFLKMKLKTKCWPNLL